MDSNGDDLDGTPAQRVTLSRGDRILCQFNCRLPGEHMAYNAAVAAVTAHRLGAEWSAIGRALSGFRGLDRRMQLVGRVNGAPVIDDYGHHPTEIEATLGALRAHHRPERRGGRLICVFQPHQHSRTRFLLDRFAESFTEADEVIVPPIYFVRDREADRAAVSAEDLVERLRNRGTEARSADRFEEVHDRVQREAGPEDLVVVMGAGPVWKIARELVGAR
jgi:UDP-N-acetylmuramate--alanine ligase